ncbi:hypothetical protein AcV7_007364 [Taiwanofungus camphoratus]|nr:hypothetical protein AcV7_007364 [Antrodia cinnamomea]
MTTLAPIDDPSISLSVVVSHVAQGAIPTGYALNDNNILVDMSAIKDVSHTPYNINMDFKTTGCRGAE